MRHPIHLSALLFAACVATAVGCGVAPAIDSPDAAIVGVDRDAMNADVSLRADAERDALVATTDAGDPDSGNTVADAGNTVADANTTVADTGTPVTDAGPSVAMCAPDPIPPNDQGNDPATCMGLRATIVGTTGPDRIRGTEGRDVIVALGGDDMIEGLGGNDVICAGWGEDTVFAGDGNDYVDGGEGSDTVWGGAGNDTMHGRDHGDYLHGGPGNDFIFGDTLDDHLYGDDGDDLIVGGHGTDWMEGGAGDDWIRGDTNSDEFFGGEGNDTASFVTDRPPGQPSTLARGENAFNGMIVDLAAAIPFANGDGGGEPIAGFERIVGSPFRDRMVGNGHTTFEGGYGDDTFQTRGADAVVAGPGRDTCNGVPCPGAGSTPDRSATVFAFVDNHPRDTGIVVLGSTGNDHLTITRVCDGAALVTATDGATITPGPGCAVVHAGAPSVVRCTYTNPLLYVLAWGDDGDDEISLGDGFPRDMTSTMDGGNGNDVLRGGDGPDILFGGMTGMDRLFGGPADDALLSLSHPDDRENLATSFHGGADYLDAGPGNDQLVADYPCGGHTFIGGPGLDIAGFARSGSRAIRAQLGGPSAHETPFHGRAFNPSVCPDFARWGTRLNGDLEIIEGSEGDDELFGDDGPNTIWGRQGNDTLYGEGGDDTISGNDGNDEIHGGPGRDALIGGIGIDHLFARDGEADRTLECGVSGGSLEADAIDPSGAGCP